MAGKIQFTGHIFEGLTRRTVTNYYCCNVQIPGNKALDGAEKDVHELHFRKPADKNNICRRRSLRRVKSAAVKTAGHNIKIGINTLLLEKFDGSASLRYYKVEVLYDFYELLFDYRIRFSEKAKQTILC